MKIKNLVIIGSSIALLAGSSSFGYRFYKQVEAQKACQNAELKEKVTTTKSAVDMINRFEVCISALKQIPFHGKEKEITIVENGISQMKSLIPLMAMAESFSTAFSQVQTKPSPSPIVKPTKVVKSADLVLCNNLDWESKNNKLPSFLDSLPNEEFRSYQNAVNKSCNWHDSQIKASLSRYSSQVSNVPTEPLEETFPTVPQTGSAVIKSQGHDLYKWQRKEMEKRDQEQAGLAWERGSGRSDDYNSDGVYVGK